MSELCTACGLCCDGSLFGRVTLAADEVPMARKHRLALVPSGGSFEQPCTALPDEGPRRCAIYDDRPRACRAFECVLYTRNTPLPERLAAVARTRELLLRARSGALPEAELGELRERMERDFARAPLTRGV